MRDSQLHNQALREERMALFLQAGDELEPRIMRLFKAHPITSRDFAAVVHILGELWLTAALTLCRGDRKAVRGLVDGMMEIAFSKEDQE